MRFLRSSMSGRLLATAFVAACMVAVMTLSLKAFAAATDGDAGRHDGQMALSDTARGVPMFRKPPMKPGESRSGCLVVANHGEGPTRVTMFGRTGGTGLDAHLMLTVVRGAASSSTSTNCAGFRPDRSDYVGLGDGVIFRGTLSAFPDDAADGLLDPGGSWQPGEAHAYRFVVRLSGQAPQGLTATQSFMWQTMMP